jgi:hypothetical protein
MASPVGEATPQSPAPWWPLARFFFLPYVCLPTWTAISLVVGLSGNDTGFGVLIGFAVAIGFPWLVLWPAMRYSATRRGYRMTVRHREW